MCHWHTVILERQLQQYWTVWTWVIYWFKLTSNLVNRYSHLNEMVYFCHGVSYCCIIILGQVIPCNSGCIIWYWITRGYFSVCGLLLWFQVQDLLGFLWKWFKYKLFYIIVTWLLKYKKMLVRTVSFFVHFCGVIFKTAGCSYARPVALFNLWIRKSEYFFYHFHVSIISYHCYWIPVMIACKIATTSRNLEIYLLQFGNLATPRKHL